MTRRQQNRSHAVPYARPWLLVTSSSRMTTKRPILVPYHSTTTILLLATLEWCGSDVVVEW